MSDGIEETDYRRQAVERGSALTPLTDEQKKIVEAFGEAMQHEVIPAVLKERDERFYAAIRQAIKDPMTPGGVQASYTVLLDDIAAKRARIEALEKGRDAMIIKYTQQTDNAERQRNRTLAKLESTRMELITLTAERDRLKEALSLLYDHQNGCPLPKYETQWNEAMRLADTALRGTQEG